MDGDGFIMTCCWTLGSIILGVMKFWQRNKTGTYEIYGTSQNFKEQGVKMNNVTRAPTTFFFLFLFLNFRKELRKSELYTLTALTCTPGKCCLFAGRISTASSSWDNFFHENKWKNIRFSKIRFSSFIN